MPTYEAFPRFLEDYALLTVAERVAFKRAVDRFVEDLRRRHIRAGLRVRGVQGVPGAYEMTWAPDGRATFHYGEPVHEGEPHIVWRRIGTHDIFRDP